MSASAPSVRAFDRRQIGLLVFITIVWGLICPVLLLAAVASMLRPSCDDQAIEAGA